MLTSTSEATAPGRKASLEERLKAKAKSLGFDSVRIADASLPAAKGEALQRFLAEGWHGDMDWLAAGADRRREPRAMWSEARTAVMFGMNYGPQRDPMSRLAARDRGAISVYAQGRDYHDVIKGRLKQIAQWLAGAAGADVKVFVDTAPLMEKPLAQAAGVGWQGKHTNLVSREHGSWLLLGAILTTAALEHDAPEADHCGSCRACLDICPTRAFPAPYLLDARRCISYLTIEHRGHIAREFRTAIGNRIYGCDDCLAVCPWNKFAHIASEAKLAPRADLWEPCLADLARLDDAGFRALFAGTAIKRTGRDRFLRNVLIAIGNSGDPDLAGEAGRLLDDGSALVRAMAVWAFARLAPPEAFECARRERRPREADPDVRREWDEA